MLSTNEWSTESSSLVAKSRCYWKIKAARRVEPQTLCWEHGRSGELCPHLKQDLRVLLVGGCGVWPPGPPCSCSATFLSIFHAVTQNGSDRNVWYCSGLLAFWAFFQVCTWKCRCEPASAFLASSWGCCGKGKAETHCCRFWFFS